MAPGVAALRVRPSWPEGAGGGAESRKSPIPAWKGGLDCCASLYRAKVVTGLLCFFFFFWWVSRWKLGKGEGEGAWAEIGDVAS